SERHCVSLKILTVLISGQCVIPCRRSVPDLFLPLSQGGEKYKFPNSNPFVEEDVDKSEVASVAYRYRQWRLGEDIDLIVRCEHDGVMTGANGEVSFINIKTLNEWDSRHCNGVDWRQKLDSQRGAVLATELKNNSYKLARWTCCAMLAGSEYLKLGYVSRYHVKDSARHVILGTQQFKPNEFASQINLSMENAWGILRCIIDTCMKLEEGKYLILKDPNKQVIRVYSLPDGTFSSDEDEDEEEEEEDEEDDGEGGAFSLCHSVRLQLRAKLLRTRCLV
ncbi:eukaryotic translation initiation factor 3 subunit D-like, partial [Polyodon spathula]|uniref:eukaryotic translation initiation factor 3 subunit D-like n=1 Tax=Polyodon spathula TaxID=7913 RepID=UPI001B7EE7F3